MKSCEVCVGGKRVFELSNFLCFYKLGIRIREFIVAASLSKIKIQIFEKIWNKIINGFYKIKYFTKNWQTNR